MTDKYYEIRNYLSNNINDFKEIVSNEFINYFGNDYRNEIISRLNITDFIFYMNTDFFTFPSESDYAKENYSRIKRERELLKKIINKNDFDNILYSSNNSICPLKEIINTNRTCIDNYNEITNEICKVIYIPLFSSSDESLIHEMVHSIMTNPIGFTNIDKRRCIFKIGLSMLNGIGEKLLEECITEINAKEIYSKVKNKISYLDKYYPLFESKCIYDKYIPLVKDLYYSHPKDINYSRITLNKNYIISILGKNSYYKYINLLESYYKNYYDCDKSLYYDKVNKLIRKMDKID